MGEQLTVNQHVAGSIPAGSVRPAHYRIDESMRSMPRRKKINAGIGCLTVEYGQDCNEVTGQYFPVSETSQKVGYSLFMRDGDDNAREC